MEITMSMSITPQDVSGRVPVFNAGAFYPGHHNGIPIHEFWSECMDDKSPLPIAHLLERAFNQRKMVVIKDVDESTHSLVRASQQRSQMDAMVSINMKTVRGGNIWIGVYNFKCYVTKILANQDDLDGPIDVVYLDIVKDSVDMGLIE